MIMELIIIMIIVIAIARSEKPKKELKKKKRKKRGSFLNMFFFREKSFYERQCDDGSKFYE
ncbi:hypothetical protein DW175_13615 [Bacteroides sp. AM16-15]|nr:hypothetical protein DW175_13615 [Bacteroides sp. AM16-15]